ncbi:hypothetical protein GCM10020295_07600 [Streptomyces cinereospinus]
MSGRGEPALRAQAAALLDHLRERPGEPLPDLAHSLAVSRAHLEERAAVVAADEASARAALTALADGCTAAGLVRGVAHTDARTAFLFTGQGAQHLGMGRELHAAHSTFADALDAALAALDAHLDRPLRDVMWGTDAPLLDRTGYAQPALFAVEVALFRLLESWGVRPDHVLGHSVGELAAAHVAGVFDLADAARLVTARGRLMQALPAGGAMVAVQAGEDEVAPLLTGQVALAAVNGPASTVLSGPEDAVLAVAERLRAAGRRTKRLAVSHAFHSALMEPMLDAFAEVAAGIRYHAPGLAVVSTLTGGPVAAELTDPGHWVGQVRATVRFGTGVRWLADHGVTTFLELGPDAALSATGPESLAPGDEAAFVPVLRRDRAEEPELVTAVARAHTRGTAVDWPAFHAGSGARRIDLPTYRFRRTWYWSEPAERTPAGLDPADEDFWTGLEQADLPALAADLGVGTEALAEVLPALRAARGTRQAEAAVADWRYRVTWQPVTDPAPGPLDGRWLLAVPEARTGIVGEARTGLVGEAPTDEAGEARTGEPLVSAVGAALAEHGAEVVPFPVGAGEDRAALTARLRQHTGVRGVLCLLALATAPHHEHPALPAGYAATVTLVQALTDAAVAAPLWCATAGAVAVDTEERPDAAQAMTHGLGTGLALDLPDLWGGLVDLPVHPDAAALRRMCAVLSDAGGPLVRDGDPGGHDPARDGRREDHVAVRPAGVFARRMVRAPSKRTRRPPGAPRERC